MITFTKEQLPTTLLELVEWLNAFYQLYSSSSLVYENLGLEDAQQFVPYSDGVEHDETKYDFINPIFQNEL